jgi:1,4-dihydroxy-2-naphthoate octaprenyltransferase
MRMNHRATSAKLGAFLAELRAPFFTASALPVVLGTMIAWARKGEFQLDLFLLTLLGGVLLHAGTNVINDYFDHLTGADDKNREFVRPFTGGSRLIQSGVLTPREVLGEARLLYALGSLIGLYLVFRAGIGVLVLGTIGLLSGLLYTLPPVALVSHGLGELAIGLNFGTLMTLGAYYVQTKSVAWEPVVASLPLAVLIAAVVFINQFQDMNADALVGKSHWVVRLGRKRAVTVYAMLLVFSYVAVVVGVGWGGLPVFALVLLGTLPLTFKAIGVARTHYDAPQALAPANATTIMLHAASGVLLSLAYALQLLV